jgi:hypothetical protein
MGKPDTVIRPIPSQVPSLHRYLKHYGIEPTINTSERLVRRDSVFEREEGS